MTSTLDARPASAGAPVPRSAPSVLVTGAGGPAGIAVVRRLMALGHRVVAADADPRATGCALADVGVLLPRADHPHFIDALIGVAAAHGADALVPTVAEELPALAAGAARLAAAGVATWLSDPAGVAVCCDKAAFARAMRAAGVPHPPTTDTPAGMVEVPGPWVVKPRAGRGSRGVHLLDRRSAVVEALRTDGSLIAQTRLVGREFTADALVARTGELLTVVPRWREETRAGISTKGSTFDSTAVTDVVASALEAVGLTGPANVQGFVTGDGSATVVEINPRFSGGLPLTLAAGADVVGAYLTGIREPERRLGHLWFTPGVSMRRYFAEVFTAADGSPVADPSVATAVRA
ncbi:ATP-grasp domain-containing protein [Trujillonella endophytica]|uniref:Carbamoyl-phosphate synthase large subunit n=1 Tax=Trujillonella endophytica TaxID=673521 RepID=A0A1H8WC81_9ACTN|nr:ATP-grasp domain-containing protein [Trujillella endophytica]SEP25047.1 carbamoyl-phosphate synthase large subunit [Trujillella endophytica]